jgi:hypothetical protein
VLRHGRRIEGRLARKERLDHILGSPNGHRPDEFRSWTGGMMQVPKVRIPDDGIW